MAPYVGFVGPSYLSRARAANAERSVNLYPELLEASSPKNASVLIGRPGNSAFATASWGPIRAMLSADERLHIVAGHRVAEVFPGGAITSRGTVAVSGDRAALVTNGAQGHQVLVLSGGHGYILDLITNVLEEIASPAFPAGATQAGFIDGYFLVLIPGTSQFAISGLFNGTAWSTLDRAARSTASDDLVALLVDHREAWLLGSETGEVWVDSGAGAAFPLTPLRGTTMQVGCLAAETFRKLRDVQGSAWLGRTDGGPQVFLAQGGYTPRPISTHAIDRILAGYGDDSLRRATAYTYQIEGHSFYSLSVPGAPVAWVYDASESQKAGIPLWHEEMHLNVAQGLEELPDGWIHAYAFGRHLTGSRTDGRIYTRSLDTYTDSGDAIRRIRRAPYLSRENVNIFHHRFELDIETGLGPLAGQGSDPFAELRWSDDGWQTATDPIPESIGQTGEYGLQVEWFGLGSSRSRSYEVASSEPVPHRWTNAYLDVTPGTH